MLSSQDRRGLIRLSLLEPLEPEPSVVDVLGVIGELLRSWRVRECIVERDGRVVEGSEIYWALYKLGARYAPSRECNASLEELGIFEDLEAYNGNVYQSTMDLMERGKPTPLVRLSWSPAPGVRVWAKLEWFNPFSLSIKDRPALYILSRLDPAKERRVYDASSSNFAIALAAVARLKGLRARVYLPRPARGGHGEVVAGLLGAEVVVDDNAELAPQLSERAGREAAAEGALHVNQFVNDYNFEAHLRGIAREIDYQRMRAGLDLAGIVGGIGTSGHMSALAFYMSNRLGALDVVLAQPSKGSYIPGIRRIETGMKWLPMVGVNYSLYDVDLEGSTSFMRTIARSDGILVGPSGAAALAALDEHCRNGRCGKGDYVVVVPDTGFKYISLVGARRGIIVE